MNPRLILALALLCQLLAAPPNGRAQVYEKVFDFTEARAEDSATSMSKGSRPDAGLVQGSDGNFYGTTSEGGTTSLGTVFRMTSAGVLTTLVEFTGDGATNKGSSPSAGLVLGRDGNFYGTTRLGGAMDRGTAFKVTPTGVLTTLVEFTGNGAANKGSSPSAGLVQGSDGNFYGTTSSGGANGFGTVFRMTPAGALTTLVEFTDNGAANKGRAPTAALVQGSDGNFYGTTLNGGASGFGTVFRMTPAGALTTLVEFTDNGAANKGRGPGALVQGSDGDFYGITGAGGASGFGTVFRMTPAGALTTLVEFTDNGAANKGSVPVGLVQGSDGDFYGTTGGGGASGDGTVFQMTPTGALTTLVEFVENGAANKGRSPVGLVQGSDGNFYSTTRRGGATSIGTVFRMTPAGALTTLVEFTGNGANSKGREPSAGLVQGSDGNFYGTTRNGPGLGGVGDKGTVFQMTPAGVVTTLVVFEDNFTTSKGSTPEAALVQGSDGNFYGTTLIGGATGDGTVFRITPAGALTTLVEFTENGAANKGKAPAAALVQGSDGDFYGTTSLGGASGFGTVFRMTPAGVLTTLVEFTGNGATNKGSSPEAALVQGSDGNFYGTTRIGGAASIGTVFQMTPAGVLTTLVEFTGNGAVNKGNGPEAALVQGSDGNFYGTTFLGGASNFGTVFRMTPAGALTTLVEFTENGAINKGQAPAAALVQGSDGNFYGTTRFGGASDFGTVFQMTPAGVLTTLVEFAAAEDGDPSAELIRAADGTLYSTTIGGDGTVFRLIFPGTPSLLVTRTALQGSASAVVEAQANARGAATTITLEYGTDGVNFPDTLPIATSLNGFQTKRVGTTLAGLVPGTTYFFRFRAVSSAGTTLTPVQSFSTLAVPTAVAGAPSGITATSATFNGMVNARNSATSVVFEWDTDPNFTSMKTATAMPETVTGSQAVPVSAAVAGLPEGGTVFYRLRVTSEGGTATSGVANFNTVNVTTANPLPEQIGVTEVVFRATVNTFGRTAAVKFKYWADSAPTVVFETATQTVTSNGPTEVSARVTGLLENVSYSYRVSVELAGTETDGGAVMFTTDTNVAPVALPDVIFYTGQVQFDPLANDSDANGDALVLDPVLVVPPTVAAAVASVTVDRLSISYNPQNNVTDEDLLTYRVLDPQGASATAQVRLIAFSKRAGFYGGRADFSGGAVTRSGVVTLQFGTSGAMSTAFFNWAGETYRLKGVFDPSGRLTRTIDLVNFAGSKLTLTLRLDPDAPLIHGSVVERDGSNAIVASVPDFTLTQNAGTGGLPEAGLRTAFLSPPASLVAQMGDGYVVMNVAKNRRSARFAGQLPDGEPFLVSAAAQGRSFSLSKALEQGGVLTGLVRVVGSDTDALGMMSDLFWKKRANTRARFHRGNVETTLELLGMKYPTLAKTALPPIDLGTGSPNARLRFTGGDLISALDFPLQIAAGSVSGFDVSQLQLKLRSDLGTFSGRFKHPVTGKFVPFQGAFRTPLDTESGQGRGVFRGPSAAGAVRIEVE